MDIKKATSVKFVDDKYGIAIFEEDYKGNPTKPTVKILIKQNKKLGSGNETPWIQMVGGWYIDTLLENGISVPKDPDAPGLYIDYGQDWYVPALPYSLAQRYMDAYTRYNHRFHDEVNVEVW